MSKETGNRGEALAEQHLIQKNFTIVQRQFKYRNGEIDLVARDGAFLVFVEVKTVNLSHGSKSDFGEPETWLTPRKQSYLRRAAEYYLFKHEIVNTDCRFDLVTVRLYADHDDIRHYENAFW